MANETVNLIDSRYPGYLSGMTDWQKWRLTYEGGDNFREAYLERFSTREDPTDFATRKAMTPVPKFAGAAINDIRNAIYQRMRDIVRKGGSRVYQEAVGGNNLGVDHRGSTMNAFLGVKVLTELLVMGRVGVFVDHPLVPAGATLADVGNPAPYLYKYDIEDILSWTCSKPEEPSEFQAILLRDTTMQYDQATFLPTLQVERYRYLHIDPDTGKVRLQFYDAKGSPVDQFGQPGSEIKLDLDRIPFVMLDIGGSLVKDVCQHWHAPLPQKHKRSDCKGFTVYCGRFAGRGVKQPRHDRPRQHKRPIHRITKEWLNFPGHQEAILGDLGGFARSARRPSCPNEPRVGEQTS